MKKYSVLVRRALVFTAIVLILAVAVGLIAFFAAGNFLDARATQAELTAYQALLSESPPSERATLLVPPGIEVWLADRDGTRALVNAQAEIPEAVSAKITAALLGNESVSRMRLNGRACMLSVFKMEDSAAAIALPVSGGSRALAALIGAFSGLLCAFLAAWALKRPLLVRAVKPIMQLRDVAVAVANGDLSARCDESAPGELGELGRAINNLSSQLARNLYTLILERNRLRQMIDGLSEGVVAVDSEGGITHANPALEKLFARGKPGVHLPDARMRVIPDSSVWADFDSVIATGEPVTRNLTVQDRTLRLTVSPIIDEIGMTAGAVGLISDITQSERLERTRREYVSNVSHELRTPLTAVRALVEPLKEGMVTSEADRMRYYDIILREVLRLSRLINDQLELSRLQSGTIAIEKKRMTLDDLVYDVCDRYQSIAEEHGLSLEIPTDFAACPPVYANADRVEELLIILLDNAIKYTEKGSVRVSAEWDDTVVRLSVSDTGIGISEEDLPYVFDRFYKVDKAHSGKGSGLGLSIAQELITRMDEEISVGSEKDQGTTFTFTIHVYQKPAE
ncbi:MAG: ATP-binding protein [Candidatus Faecivicinus sp.]|nr:ATP-binding protein [Candidatus Faecivicinus sp.]